MTKHPFLSTDVAEIASTPEKKTVGMIT